MNSAEQIFRVTFPDGGGARRPAYVAVEGDATLDSELLFFWDFPDFPTAAISLVRENYSVVNASLVSEDSGEVIVTARWKD